MVWFSVAPGSRTAGAAAVAKDAPRWSRARLFLAFAQAAGADLTRPMLQIGVNPRRLAEWYAGAPRDQNDPAVIAVIRTIERALTYCSVCRPAAAPCNDCSSALRRQIQAFAKTGRVPTPKPRRVSGNEKCEICMGIRCKRH